MTALDAWAHAKKKKRMNKKVKMGQMYRKSEREWCLSARALKAQLNFKLTPLSDLYSRRLKRAGLHLEMAPHPLLTGLVPPLIPMRMLLLLFWVFLLHWAASLLENRWGSVTLFWIFSLFAAGYSFECLISWLYTHDPRRMSKLTLTQASCSINSWALLWWCSELCR